ncbi:MAG: aromatic ring-hydroxylating dioxygenase subunit alpha, partial [Alphaproteobacteria bacterium]|nr:aromatic ring-hydroxylating dioxygenase subunit alpha [Alphaproteobacteria bacterium]
MADIDPQLTHGKARSPGVSWTALMGADSRPAPQCLTEESYEYLGSEPLEASRYTSEEFAKLEREKMWPYVWQFAAREEDLPEAGDYVVFENAGRSWLISRQDDGSVRAFHNVCLHRGRKLRTEDGHADSFQCPFHGFQWKKDGSYETNPCPWDFSHLSKEELQLPEAEVAHWGGYIFIREEKGGPSLEEFLAPLPEHFKRWKHEECTTVIWVAKEVPANWKVTAEAFMEAWHTLVTHPQILPFTGDSNSAYWHWGDNVNVNLVPFGVLSPHIDPTGKTEQWIVDEFIKYNGRSSDNYDASADPYAVQVPSGNTARATLGSKLRNVYAAGAGY